MRVRARRTTRNSRVQMSGRLQDDCETSARQTPARTFKRFPSRRALQSIAHRRRCAFENRPLLLVDGIAARSCRSPGWALLAQHRLRLHRPRRGPMQSSDPTGGRSVDSRRGRWCRRRSSRSPRPIRPFPRRQRSCWISGRSTSSTRRRLPSNDRARKLGSAAARSFHSPRVA